VEPGIHELLLADPDIDEVITWSKAEWVKLWKSGQRLELLRRVRRCGASSTPAASTWPSICRG
jgi:heptosyltransferase-1